MNRFLKITINILIISILLFNLTNVKAFSSKIEPNFRVAAEDTLSLEGWDEAASENAGITDANTTLKNATGRVLVLVKYICVVIAVIILTVIGAKYMIASPGDRADIKKHAIAYVAGAIILFGASGILEIILKLSEQIKA